MTMSDWIQVSATLAAVGASIVALAISFFDRRNARDIARRDREIGILREELERTVQLIELNSYGGSTDVEKNKQVGAKRLSLISALGERVPGQWQEFSKGATAKEIREHPLCVEGGEALVAQRRNESIAAALDIITEIQAAQESEI